MILSILHYWMIRFYGMFNIQIMTMVVINTLRFYSEVCFIEKLFVLIYGFSWHSVRFFHYRGSSVHVICSLAHTTAERLGSSYIEWRSCFKKKLHKILGMMNVKKKINKFIVKLQVFDNWTNWFLYTKFWPSVNHYAVHKMFIDHVHYMIAH